MHKAMTHSSYATVTLLSHLHIAIPTFCRLEELHRKKATHCRLQLHIRKTKRCRTFSCNNLLIYSQFCTFIFWSSHLSIIHNPNIFRANYLWNWFGYGLGVIWRMANSSHLCLMSSDLFISRDKCMCFVLYQDCYRVNIINVLCAC